MKISKIDAFTLMIKTMEKGDEKSANEMLRIIQKSISKETRNTFCDTIEISGKKEEKYFKPLLDNVE